METDISKKERIKWRLKRWILINADTESCLWIWTEFCQFIKQLPFINNWNVINTKKEPLTVVQQRFMESFTHILEFAGILTLGHLSVVLFLCWWVVRPDKASFPSKGKGQWFLFHVFFLFLLYFPLSPIIKSSNVPINVALSFWWYSESGILTRLELSLCISGFCFLKKK